MLGYSNGKRSGSKIAWANRKESDRIGVGPPLTALYLDPPLPCYPISYWLRILLSQTFSLMNTPTFLKPSHSTPTCLWRWNRQSVPKCRHIKFRHWGITQKKAYNNIRSPISWNSYHCHGISLLCDSTSNTMLLPLINQFHKKTSQSIF